MEFKKELYDICSKYFTDLRCTPEEFACYTDILALALLCDLHLKRYEKYIEKKYEKVNFPFSQMHRSIDILSLPVLDKIVDPAHEVESYISYQGELKKRIIQVYKHKCIDDTEVAAHKKRLQRAKGNWKKMSDKGVQPYNKLIRDKDGQLLGFRIEYKELFVLLMRFLPYDLPMSLMELRSKTIKWQHLSKDLQDLDNLIQEFYLGIEELFKNQKKFMTTKNLHSECKIEFLLGELIFLKKIEKILPLSQIKAINDTNGYQSLHAFKVDFNCVILRNIDKYDDLYMSKVFLGVLLYSIKDANVINRKEFFSELLKWFYEQIGENYDLESTIEFFRNSKVQQFISTLGQTNFANLEQIQDPMKIFSYLQKVRRDPISRTTKIANMNERFNFLKGEDYEIF